jgi:hypothetical protein
VLHVPRDPGLWLVRPLRDLFGDERDRMHRRDAGLRRRHEQLRGLSDERELRWRDAHLQRRDALVPRVQQQQRLRRRDALL